MTIPFSDEHGSNCCLATLQLDESTPTKNGLSATALFVLFPTSTGTWSVSSNLVSVSPVGSGRLSSGGVRTLKNLVCRC
jgi:hypothetical protein